MSVDLMGLFGYSKEDKLKKIWHILHAQLFGFYLYIENKQYSDHFLVTDEVSLRNRSLNERISDKSVMLFEYKTDVQEYIDSFQSGKGDKDVTTIGLSAYNLAYNIETLIDLVTRVERERNQKNLYYHHYRCEHFLSNIPQKINMEDWNLIRLFDHDNNENNIEYKGISEHLWDSYWGHRFFTKDQKKNSS
jgi:hypothetical protein